ncbi:MAG: dihydrofolate reductase family protein [Gemmatimonadota bacterium]
MRKLISFTSISLDGYFSNADGDMSWAHSQDPEWSAYIAGNASGNGMLVFGRLTYDMMASFWPTPAALQTMPEVARGMNSMPKTVFSRSLNAATWANTTLHHGNPATEIRRLKRETGPDMAILGSGTIVAQLAQEQLIDEIQVVVVPLVLGTGRSLFAGSRRLPLTLTSSRAFGNGNVVLSYAPNG